MSSPLASATFRDQVLFIQYSTPDSYLGNLLAINTAPNSRQPIASAIPQAITNGNASPVDPFDQSSMFYSLQNLPYSPPSLNLRPVSASMVSTATSSQGIGTLYELLIAFNLPTNLSVPPLMLQLLPVDSNQGTGLDPSDCRWDMKDRGSNPALSVNGTNRVWLASGINAGTSKAVTEGSAMYEMIQNPSTFTLQMKDVSQADPSGNVLINPSWTAPITALLATQDPKMIRLSDSALYDAVLVGQCANSSSICLVFMKGETQNLVSTSTLYDQLACFTAGNGKIIMVSDTATNTLAYSNGTLPLDTWTEHTNIVQGSSPNQILACATLGTTVYAITPGSKVMPDVWSMDISNDTLTWSPRSLRQSVDYPGGGGSGSHPPNLPSKHSSTALRVGVIVAVVVVIAVFLYVYYKRRTKNNTKDPFRGMITSEALPRPGATPPSRSQGPGAIPLQPLVYQQNPYSSPQPQPQQVVATPSRAGSWTAETAAAVASAAVAYNAQTSFNNMAPTTSAPYSSAGPTYSGPGPVAYSAPGHMPIIASSLSIAPFRPFIVPLGSPVMSENGGFSSQDTRDLGAGSSHIHRHSATSEAVGKQEFDEIGSTATDLHENEDGSPLVRSRPIVVPSAASTTSASTSMQQPLLTRNVRPIQEMMSPAMVNAQLILQQSQGPPPRQQL